eukprot:COSAG06_NODE_968_length_11280_cov_125.578302_6_plen_68_part_00
MVERLASSGTDQTEQEIFALAEIRTAKILEEQAELATAEQQRADAAAAAAAAALSELASKCPCYSVM